MTDWHAVLSTMENPTQEQISKFRKDFYIKKNTPNDVVIELYKSIYDRCNKIYSKNDIGLIIDELDEILKG